MAIGCQVVAHREFPCSNRERNGNGFQCERLDKHEAPGGCWISEHTIQHDLAGNGYACEPIDQSKEKYLVAELQTVTICGSMRFFSHMMKVATAETELGNIVLMPFSTSKENAMKGMLDLVHRHKIEMADRIAWVTNDKHYLGTSTRNEINYALSIGLDVVVYEFASHDTWNSFELPDGYDLGSEPKGITP